MLVPPIPESLMIPSPRDAGLASSIGRLLTSTSVENAVGAAVIDEQGRRTDIIGVVQAGPLGTFQRRVQAALYLPMSQDVLASMSMSRVTPDKWL
jgi:hypothetical protein